MPVYEFFCKKCNTIFNFLSQSVNTAATPPCPKCKQKKMERQVSMFAISKGQTEADAPDGFPDLDDDAMEKVMMSMEKEMSGVDEDDPKAMARMMRKLSDATGMKFGDGMEEAMRRMEKGEDPDKIEEEMGDMLEDENELFGEGGVKAKLRLLAEKFNRPKIDPTLYEM